MIPTEDQCKKTWEKYQLPGYKRKHVMLVVRVAKFLAEQLKIKTLNLPRRQAGFKIDEQLLIAGALLHDLDKAVPRLPDEQHPDTAVRILEEEGMKEVAELVKTHSLHAILDPAICPKTWEEKLLYLADKMVKQEIITVDKRFALWNDEHLHAEAQAILDGAYPKVKVLEKEIFDKIGLKPEDIAKLA